MEELQREVSKRSQVSFIQQVRSEHPLCTSCCFGGWTGCGTLHFWAALCKMVLVLLPADPHLFPYTGQSQCPCSQQLLTGTNLCSGLHFRPLRPGKEDVMQANVKNLLQKQSHLWANPSSAHVYLLPPHPEAPCLSLFSYFRLQVHWHWLTYNWRSTVSETPAIRLLMRIL